MHRRFLAVALLATAAFAPPAAARTVQLVSGGNPNPGSAHVTSLGISRDGSVGVFRTSESLVPADPADGYFDWYARAFATGALHRVTQSEATVSEGVLVDMSDDGSRLWYTADGQEVAGEDTDVGTDLYELRLAADPANDTRRLISAGTEDVAVIAVGGTADGALVAYRTTEDLDGGAGDADAVADVYARTAAGATVLLTPGTTAEVTSAQLLRDGSRLLFETTESLVAADQDATVDLYDVPVTGGAYRLRSTWTGPENRRVTHPVDGRMWVETVSSLAPADADATADVYAIAPDGTARLLSPGGTGGVSLERVSADGYVALNTDAALLPADADGTGRDIYVAAPDGTLRLASGGSDPAATISIFLLGPRGAVAFFTPEPLAPGDGDGGESQNDLYLRTASGALQLLTPGLALASGNYFPTEAFGAPEAARPLFQGPDLPGTGDVNGVDDLYEVTADGVVKVGPPTATRGEAGGPTSLLAEPPAQSADGSRIVFRTLDRITGEEDATNIWFDAYLATWEPPTFAGPPAATGAGRVGQALTCAPQAATGDERIDVTVAWLRDGAPIAGATRTRYVVAAADAGAAIACRATASGPAGTDTADSAPIQVAPTANATALVGFPIRGTRLTCTAFTGADTTAYRWKRGTTPVAGRTARSYLIGAADLGLRITCEATGTANPGAVTTVALARTVPRRCVVPRLRGRTRIDATTRLRERGCRVVVRRVGGRGVAAGRVLRTSPAAGKRIANGATVTVFVRR